VVALLGLAAWGVDAPAGPGTAAVLLGGAALTALAQAAITSTGAAAPSDPFEWDTARLRRVLWRGNAGEGEAAEGVALLALIPGGVALGQAAVARDFGMAVVGVALLGALALLARGEIPARERTGLWWCAAGAGALAVAALVAPGVWWDAAGMDVVPVPESLVRARDGVVAAGVFGGVVLAAVSVAGRWRPAGRQASSSSAASPSTT
jgi:hypothetical protein